MSNNIRFNDKSLAVSYIQAFLRENYSANVLPTNIYDLQTHEALISYLEQPNVEDLTTAEKVFKETYNELHTMFTLSREQNSLVYTCKRIDKATSDFISENLQELKDLATSIGWQLTSYNDYIDYTLDINQDNAVDTIDRSMLQKYLETGMGLTQDQIKRADFNVDGKVDQLDYNLLVDFITNQK